MIRQLPASHDPPRLILMHSRSMRQCGDEVRLARDPCHRFAANQARLEPARCPGTNILGLDLVYFLESHMTDDHYLRKTPFVAPTRNPHR